MVISRSAQLLISLILKIYLVVVEAELIWFVAMIILDAILTSIFYFISYKWKENDFSFLRKFHIYDVAQQKN